MSLPSTPFPDGAPQGGRRSVWAEHWLLLLSALAVLVFLAWPVVTIQLRLWRNGALASQLAEELRTEFPGTNFQGSASYESEEISISVFDHVDEPIQRAAEEYLRLAKARRGIRPEVWLRFVGDDRPDIKF